MFEIKKVLRNIYKFDLSKCEVDDGYEMITVNGINDFVNTFKKRDLDNGIIVTPGGYSRGLIYKSTNGGEFYNNPSWIPDIISFTFDIYGLKKGFFYKLTVRSRNTHRYNNITDISENRNLDVTTDSEEILLHEDVSSYTENHDFITVFRANSSEMTLLFNIGKIYINDIIIDEVELLDEETDEDSPDIELEKGKRKLVAYGIFNPTVSGNGRYLEADKLSGKGIRLFYDNNNNNYIIERDNITDMISAPFTNVEYYIDINTNKLPITNSYDRFVIDGVESGVSPNMLKQGYITFALLDKFGKKSSYAGNGRIVILIYKFY